MFNGKLYKYAHFIKYGIASVILACLAASAPAQESAESPPEAATPALVTQRHRITAVTYDIKGHTRQYPLSQAVPIDTTSIFDSEQALQDYIEALKRQFKNIRTIQSAQINAKYGIADSDGVVPVMLTVIITDTWNFIALPYPSFDSNSGFQLKLKMQDFNFIGTLQPLKADITYRSTETERQIFSSSLNFALPFKAGRLDMLWDNSFQIVYAHKEVPKINIASGLEASFKANKHFSLVFGIAPELIINDRSSNQITAVDPTKQPPPRPETPPPTSEQREIPFEDEYEDKNKTGGELGYLYPQDRYYFNTMFYLRTPVMITETKNFGSLVWTPSVNLAGNWAFDGIQADELNTWKFAWGHTLSLSKVNWEGNFRKGLSFSFGNTYSYLFYKAKKTDIGFTASLTGYYPFLNRIGIYGRTQFFYYLFNATSTRAGVALRGILNKRIDTDTGFTFNLDIPIGIASLDFQAITDVAWTRFLNCDIQLVPFLDIAFVHDFKTGRYYHPADGWYSGGMEVIVYPEKMRSIYVRASIGFDLSELKNVPGPNKIDGRAKRDGESVSEIFIGIGVHY